MYEAINSKPCVCVAFEEMAMSHMRRNACGCHVMSQETSKQSSFGLLSLDNAFIDTIKST